MTIDESRQNGKTSQIDDIGFIRVTTHGFDAFDMVAINNNRYFIDGVTPSAVKKSSVSKSKHATAPLSGIVGRIDFLYSIFYACLASISRNEYGL